MSLGLGTWNSTSVLECKFRGMISLPDLSTYSPGTRFVELYF